MSKHAYSKLDHAVTASLGPGLKAAGPGVPIPALAAARCLHGKRVAMVVFSDYRNDPRPRRTAEALIDLGMSVDLVCPSRKGESPKHETLNGVQIRRIPVTHRRGGALGYIYQYSAFPLMSAVIFSFRSLIRRYDVVYVHNMPDVLVVSGLIPRLLGAKVILDLHDPMPELMMTILGSSENSMGVRLLKLLEKWSIGFVDAVITVNRACAKLFSSRSCPLDKITVVMNSSDEKLFPLHPASKREAPQSNNDPFVIMYHGSMVERNGLRLAVQAFAMARRAIPNAELRVYGAQNPFLDSVMDSVRRLGLEGAVHYMGAKPLEKIVEAIAQCDVGIIPNLRNIFTELNTPTRIFEYLALGKPVIAPRAPGICDYFDEKSLVFFELGSAEDLAGKIEYVFNHPDEAMEITKRGQKVHEEHTWREEKQRLTGLLARLLSGVKVGQKSINEIATNAQPGIRESSFLPKR